MTAYPLLGYYILFAVTTSLVAQVELLNGIFDSLDDEHVLSRNRMLSRFIFFCLTTLSAPFVLLPLIFPEMNKRFIDAFVISIRD